MKIYKAIFRLDYPLNFVLLDRLGEHLEFIKEKTKVTGFTSVKYDINLVNHLITIMGSYEKNPFTVNLTLNDFDGVIEFTDGILLNDLPKLKFFGIIDNIIKELEKTNSKYDRIGFRAYVIHQSESLKFSDTLNLMVSNNEKFTKPFSEYFRKLNDVALIMEAIDQGKDSLRVTLGPYKEMEWQKYFSNNPDISEGLMFDIDSFQMKLDQPGFKMSNFIEKSDTIISKIIADILKQFEN